MFIEFIPKGIFVCVLNDENNLFGIVYLSRMSDVKDYFIAVIRQGLFKLAREGG